MGDVPQTPPGLSLVARNRRERRSAAWCSLCGACHKPVRCAGLLSIRPRKTALRGRIESKAQAYQALYHGDQVLGD